MFNFFGALGQLGRMLPGYMEGERNAIKDNWYDLNQYSDVQGKQLRNLFTEATFNPRVNMQYDAAAQSRMATEQAGMQNEYYQAAHPGNLEAAAITGTFAPLHATLLNYMRAQAPWMGGIPWMGGAPWMNPNLGFDGLMDSGTYAGIPAMRGGGSRGGGVNRPAIMGGR